MNKSKVRGLKWNLKKLKGLILHFTLKFIMEFTMNVRRGNIFFFEVSKNFPSCIVSLREAGTSKFDKSKTQGNIKIIRGGNIFV